MTFKVRVGFEIRRPKRRPHLHFTPYKTPEPTLEPTALAPPAQLHSACRFRVVWVCVYARQTTHATSSHHDDVAILVRLRGINCLRRGKVHIQKRVRAAKRSLIGSVLSSGERGGAHIRRKVQGKTMMWFIVNGDVPDPSKISCGHRYRPEFHGIQIGRSVSALPLLHCDPPEEVVCGLTDLVALQVNEIGRGAFAGSPVSSLLIPDNVAWVGDAAFEKCYCLEKVVCHARVLERECFKRCYKLKTVVLGGQLEVVPEDVFGYCDALQSVTIASTVHTIEPKAFEYCVSLSHVDLSGSSLSVIKEEAFLNCESLKKFVIPKDVAEIHEGAFRGCTRLETVEFERWLPCTLAFASVSLSSKRTRCRRDSCIVDIDERAFQDCRSLAKMCFPGSIRNIEEVGLPILCWPSLCVCLTPPQFCFDGCRNLRLVIFEPRTPENDTDPTRATRITVRYNGGLRNLPEDLFISSVAFQDCKYVDSWCLCSRLCIDNAVSCCRRLYGLVVLRPAWFDGAQLSYLSGLRVVYANSETIEALCTFSSREKCQLVAWKRSAPSGYLDPSTLACFRAGAPASVWSSNPDDEEIDMESYVKYANSPPHLSVGMRKVQAIVRESMYWCTRSFGSWEPCKREWIRTVMMVAHRRGHDRTTLPVLPKEMWYMVLGLIQEKDIKVTLS